jgi:hypothetical protein|tara:strand:+ start:5659 stop:6189 length:531 start_codon:yes stop_codon:yes gene_type:complete
MTDELERRVAQLESEVRRLRAREEALATFNQYLYGIDTGFIPDILDAFSENAILDVINFPPDGVDMHFEGRSEMEPLYERYQSRSGIISGGHNATNISLVIQETSDTASLTSYFTTTRPGGIQGGRYEGFLALESDKKWRFSKLAIISSWGWKTDTAKLSDSVTIDRSLFGGKSAQ